MPLSESNNFNLNSGLDVLTIEKAYLKIRKMLEDNGFKSAALDARLLIQECCELDHNGFILEGDHVLSEARKRCLDTLMKRRLLHEPISRILGRREFFGIRFEIGPATLDPRPDSETLVETALQLYKDGLLSGGQQDRLRILDLGTGSGALIISILKYLPKAIGVATDNSEEAIRIAKRNAISAGVNERVEFHKTDWTHGVTGKFHLILSNPPYIPIDEIAALDRDVRDYDPFAALQGGKDGLDAYREIIPQASFLLDARGYLLLETGAGQGAAVREILSHNGYNTEIKGYNNIKDIAGKQRCILANI